ncbi:MAG: hypothetical protein LIP03_10595 [Bacteroidales bacterium]|nr:hypothetical protein [Bacteroidales bacterium]
MSKLKMRFGTIVITVLMLMVYSLMTAKAKGVVMIPEYYPLDSAIVYYVDSVLHCPDYSGYMTIIDCGEWPNGSPAICLYETTELYEIEDKDYICGYIKIGENNIYLRSTPYVDLLFQNSYGEYVPLEYGFPPPVIYYPVEDPEWYFGWRDGVMEYWGTNMKISTLRINPETDLIW